MMNSYRRALDFLKSHNWTLLECRDLGTTAHTLIVEKEGQRAVLKVLREEPDRVPAALVETDHLKEYQILRYLMTTPMRRHIPTVRKWLPDLNGFLMEYLCAFPKLHSLRN